MKINNIWNAQIGEHEGELYVLKNVGYNQNIKPGEQIKIGFTGGYEGEIKEPTAYEVVNCTEQIVPDEDIDITFRTTVVNGQQVIGQINITNNTTEKICNWKLEFDLDGTIKRFWTADILSSSNNHYIVKSKDYNLNIEPHQTIVLGFEGYLDGIDQKPSNYKLTKVTN